MPNICCHVYLKPKVETSVRPNNSAHWLRVQVNGLSLSLFKDSLSYFHGTNISMNKIQRKSSIEREPQTLSLDQIRDARQAALYVLRNHSIEEAVRIFTEGLQPVLSVKNGNRKVNMRMDSDEDRVGFNHVLARLRDTATAPF